MQMSNAHALRVTSGITWVQQLGDDPWPEVARWLLHYEDKDTALVPTAWEVWREVYERGLWRGHYTSWKDVKKHTNFDSVFSPALSAQGNFQKAERVACLQIYENWHVLPQNLLHDDIKPPSFSRQFLQQIAKLARTPYPKADSLALLERAVGERLSCSKNTVHANQNTNASYLILSDVQKVLSNEPIKSIMKAAQTTQKKDKVLPINETGVVPQAHTNGSYGEGEDAVPDASDDHDENGTDVEELIAGVDSPNKAEDAKTTDIVDTPRDARDLHLGNDGIHDDKVPGPPDWSDTPTRCGLRKRKRESPSSRRSDHPSKKKASPIDQHKLASPGSARSKPQELALNSPTQHSALDLEPIDESTTLIDMMPPSQHSNSHKYNPASLEVVAGRKKTCSPAGGLHERVRLDSNENDQSYLTAAKEGCQTADEISMPYTPTSQDPRAGFDGNSQPNVKAFKETINSTTPSPDVRMVLTAPSSSTRRAYFGGQVVPSSNRAGAMTSLEPTRWISATAIELVVASLPLQNIRAFDAAFVDMQNPESIREKATPRIKSSDKVCFIPLYFDSHYTLLIIDLQSWLARYYDSLRLPVHELRARQVVQNMKALISGSDSADRPDCFQVQDFISQSNDYDCGICMLISLIDGLVYPLDKSSLDLDLWRLAFRTLIGDFSGGPDDTSTPVVVPRMLLSSVPEVHYVGTMEELQSVKEFLKQLASRTQHVHQISIQIARRLKCLYTILSAAQYIIRLLREVQQSHARKIKYLNANIKDFGTAAAEHDDLNVDYPAFAKTKGDMIATTQDVLRVELSKAKSVTDNVERWSRVTVVCKNLERRYEADHAASSKELEEHKELVGEWLRGMAEGVNSMLQVRSLFDANGEGA